MLYKCFTGDDEKTSAKQMKLANSCAKIVLTMMFLSVWGKLNLNNFHTYPNAREIQQETPADSSNNWDIFDK